MGRSAKCAELRAAGICTEEHGTDVEKRKLSAQTPLK